MKTEIIPVRISPTQRENTPQADTPEIGKWYWVRDDDDESTERRFACIVHIGSNYAEFESPSGSSWRIHLDNFWQRCEFEPNPEEVIKKNVGQYQGKVHELMEEVRVLTARLAIAPSPALSGASEAQALAVRGNGPDMKDYKAALITAREKTLPELFDQIKANNNQLAHWMSASIIPLKAQAEGLKDSLGAIKTRIFSVELYAGLVEEVEQIREGAPAPLTEKLRLFQRRAYMDEECLAQYETGGMDFKSIGAFNKWLCREDNLNRILPFPRCLLAFRVRRQTKEREWQSLSDFFRIIDEEKADKATFLYIRNGEQVFFLRTGIEFDEKLFPDMERSKLDGKVWAYMFTDRVDKIISDDEYQGLLEEDRKKDEEINKLPEKERWWRRSSYRESERYKPFTPDNIYYDDIAAFIREEMNKHNRLVLVLQGLLDRSPVLHPHPPWQLWTGEGFSQALELVYDDSKALVAGDLPDFEAYRRRLNASLKDGSVTIGQDDFWARREGEKEAARMDRDWRTKRGDWRPTHHRPHGNPGPGLIAHVAKFNKRSGTCTYEWGRKRSRDSWDEDAPKEIGCSITIPVSKLLNLDAYKPGDFKQFFNDPRTRAQYLKWAPLLLLAEEYHAGNKKARPPQTKPPRNRTEDGAYKYRLQKRRKETIGKAVRLVQVLELRDGSQYEIGTLWRVRSFERDGFNLMGIDKNGQEEKTESGSCSRYVIRIPSYYFEIDPTIPPPNTEDED